MTPKDIILIGKRMRDAQREWPDHPRQVSIVAAALEREFDDAVQQYLRSVREAAAS